MVFNFEAIAEAVTIDGDVNFDYLDTIMLPNRQCRRREARRLGDLCFPQEQLSHCINDVEHGGLTGPIGTKEQVDFTKAQLKVD